MRCSSSLIENQDLMSQGLLALRQWAAVLQVAVNALHQFVIDKAHEGSRLKPRKLGRRCGDAVTNPELTPSFTRVIIRHRLHT